MIDGQRARRHGAPAPSVKMVYDGHMDKLKKIALTVALFVAVWALAALVFGLVLYLHEYMGRPWYKDAIAFGIGVGALTVYDRVKEW